MKKSKIIIILGLFFAFGIGGFFYFNTQLEANAYRDIGIDYEVTENATINSVLNDLAQKKLIKNATVAKFYAKIKGYNKVYKGTFELHSYMSVPDILEKLSSAKNIKVNHQKLTIIPGTKAIQVAKDLSKILNISQEEIIDYWNDDNTINNLANKYPFLTEKNNNSKLIIKLEGFLLPETYFIEENQTIQTVTDNILQHTKKVFDELHIAYNQAYDLVTFASILQSEGGKSKNFATIAGVFKNRLDRNMRLESSSTSCYVIEKATDWKVCEQNTHIDSPYNTYLYAGLPIGAIGSPSKEALMAALNPEKNDYLFFVADVINDNGAIYYSKTFEEHKKKVKEVLGY